MANWAIVIGIDSYSMKSLSLKGAVRDALRMREWLLKEGDVPEKNLFLLLSPAPTSPPTAALSFDDPIKDTIIDVIATKLIPQSKGRGERFYFYYSGHGLSDRINFSDEEAIVTKDFSLLHTDKTFGLRSIREYFQATQFEDQFFFIDACRNFPDPTGKNEFRIGEWPRPQKIDPSLPAVQQFVFYATSPGSQAIELADANNERGAFTDVLLEGLGGAGRAKAWDVATQQYIVRVDRLFEYILDEVTKKRLAVPSDSARKLFQVPRLDGERGATGGSNPVMARFDPEVTPFPDVPLNVRIVPFKTESEIEVNIERDGVTIKKQAQVAQVPVSFALQPKEYSVRASAIDHDPKQKRWSVELYDPQDLRLDMVPKPPPPPAPTETKAIVFESSNTELPMAGGGAEEDSGPLWRSPDEGCSILSGAIIGEDSSPEAGHLIVEATDPLAILEVADNTGRVINSGEGHLDCQGLEPGFYRARLQNPEDAPIERLVELSPGETEEVSLSALPPPQTELSAQVVAAANLLARDDTAQSVSRTAGPLSSVQLSTFLIMAGSVINSEQLWGQRLRALGFKSFQEAAPSGAQSGLQILAAVEAAPGEDAPGYISSIKLRIWPLEEPVPEAVEHATPLATINALAEFVKPTQPGPHSLLIEMPDQPPVVFALAMLPGHLTMMIIYLDAAKQVRIFQYIPALAGGGVTLDPVLLRRLELMQRFYQRSRLDYAYRQAGFLLAAKPVEPLSGCLAGYLLLRLNKPDELAGVADQMVGLYPQLADSHVLMAESAASRKDAEAVRAASLAALDQGLPVFAEGLSRLYDNVMLHELEHPRVPLLVDVFQRRVRSLLWTSWMPDKDKLSPPALP